MQRFSVQLTVIALLVAVVALGVAVWALVKTSPPSTAVAGTSSGQSGDSKARVCGAFELVRNAVTLQTNTNIGTDPVAVQAVAANARLATLGGGLFLLSTLTDDVPSELADSVRSFAGNLEYIGMSQLAGQRAEDPAQFTRMNDAQGAANRIVELCK